MGLLAALLSALFSSSKDLMSKRLAFRLDGTASTFASFAFALPFYVLLLAGLYLFGHEAFTYSLAFLTLVLLRSITDTFAEWMKMYALGHGDLSVVAIAFSLSPLFLLVTSPLITRVPITWAEVVAVLLVVGGSMLMVYRPSAANWTAQKKGILLAFGASLFFSFNSCFDYLAVQKETPLTSGFAAATFAGFSMTLLSAAILCPFVLGRGDRLKALHSHQGGLLIRGFLEVAFMVCKLYALEFMDAPAVVGIQRLSLLLSIIGGRVFFKEADFKRRLAAGALIVVGVSLLAWWQLLKHTHAGD
ncbi:MAG TPA: EamA family transporter [Gemmataceae bacterium]|nr:EamA family transporter [Gemmataceae bacterium]